VLPVNLRYFNADAQIEECHQSSVPNENSPLIIVKNSTGAPAVVENKEPSDIGHESSLLSTTKAIEQEHAIKTHACRKFYIISLV
jgi:hypothetical protein